MPLSKSPQKIMMDDGCPPGLFLDAAARAAAWVESPPRPLKPFKPAEQPMFEVMQEIPRARKIREKFDPTGKRWDSLRNKWMPDPSYLPTQTQGDTNMSKWKITCYNEDDQPISRGTSSIEEGLPQADILVKMGSVYHRQPAGSVKKILVTDAADGLIREWTEEQSDLPKPEDEAPEPKTKGKKAKVVKPAKPDKPAKEKKAATGEKQKGLKRPGVIAAVIEIIGAAKGCSVDEAGPLLLKRFPERLEESMKNTFKIQASKNCVRKVKDEKRGVVYYGK